MVKENMVRVKTNLFFFTPKLKKKNAVKKNKAISKLGKL